MFNILLSNNVSDSPVDGMLPIIAFIAIIIAGLFGWIKTHKHRDTVKSADDLVDYLMNYLDDKIIPFITELALAQELKSTTFEDFVNKCVENFAEKLYVYVEANLEDFKIPENLRIFLNVETIKQVTHKVCSLDQVNDLLKEVYENYWNKRIEEMELLEKEEMEKNKEYMDDGTDKELHTIDENKLNMEAPIPEISQEQIIDTTEVLSEEELIETEDNGGNDGSPE
ncbi:MAG: hypothetical protein IKA36_02400 [Clostridia bacterium]|nr:hypothetical protein [Clostridia bacterium]